MTMTSARNTAVSLPMLSIGFCTDIAGEEGLRAAGVERVWRRGNGVESLDDAVFEFRGWQGALVVTDDLRIFGLTQKEIFARCSALMNAGIKVVDINHPSNNIHDLQRRAFVALHAAAPIRNHRIARRRGRMGGLAKAAAAQAARDGRCSPDIVARLCRHPALTWEDCAANPRPAFFHIHTSTHLLEARRSKCRNLILILPAKVAVKSIDSGQLSSGQSSKNLCRIATGEKFGARHAGQSASTLQH